MIRALIALTALFALQSCVTADKCASRFPAPEKTTIRENYVLDTLYLHEYTAVFTDTTNCPPNLSDTTIIVTERTRIIPGQKVIVERLVRDTVLRVERPDCPRCPEVKKEIGDYWKAFLAGAVVGGIVVLFSLWRK